MPKKPSPSDKKQASQFVFELADVDLTDDEIAEVQNEITKIALGLARKKGAKPKPKEPFVKVIHVKQIHSRVIK
jgi:hypothetical protein